jgi:hypothetical protein
MIGQQLRGAWANGSVCNPGSMTQRLDKPRVAVELSSINIRRRFPTPMARAIIDYDDKRISVETPKPDDTVTSMHPSAGALDCSAAAAAGVVRCDGMKRRVHLAAGGGAQTRLRCHLKCQSCFELSTTPRELQGHE